MGNHEERQYPRSQDAFLGARTTSRSWRARHHYARRRRCGRTGAEFGGGPPIRNRRWKGSHCARFRRSTSRRNRPRVWRYVRVLLDTHAFLWIAGNWKNVKAPARRVLSDPGTALFLSAASVWEISIKAMLGRLLLPATPSVYVPRRIVDFRITVVEISAAHALEVFNLPPHHGDPFDRMIVAQARLEALTVATRDKIFRKYGAATLAI